MARVAASETLEGPTKRRLETPRVLLLTDSLTPCIPRRRHQVRALAHLAESMHARRERGSHDLGADIVERLGEDAHRVARGAGIGVLKRDGEDDALAGKVRFAV